MSWHDATNWEAASVLLWAQVVLLWTVVNYLVGADPISEPAEGAPIAPRKRTRWTAEVAVRSVAAGIVAVILAQGSGAWVLGGLLLVLCLVLPLLRARVRPSLVGELELLLNAVFAGSSLAIVLRGRLVARYSTPWPANKVAAGCLIVALFLFVLRGGTYIVRGLLNKCGTLPAMNEGGSQSVVRQANLDLREINRGRLIGNLERILLVIMVAGGKFEALAFLVAAKGLIRSKDLENRNWAEYFLVGTLASVLVAVGVGLCVGLILSRLW